MSDGVRVFTLQSSEIPLYWSEIEPLLARIAGADFTLDGMREELEGARAQLWGYCEAEKIRAIWVTRIDETAEGRRGLIWAAAGNGLAAGLRMLREHTEPWLMAMGCTSVQIIGRRGWMRLLPEYREAGVVLVRDLV